MSLALRSLCDSFPLCRRKKWETQRSVKEETELLIGCGGGKEAERISRQRFSGLKNTVSVDIFYGKRLGLRAAVCSWSPSQMCAAGLPEPESLWNSSRNGDMGWGLWVTKSEPWTWLLATAFFSCCLPFSDNPSSLIWLDGARVKQSKNGTHTMILKLSSHGKAHFSLPFHPARLP